MKWLRKGHRTLGYAIRIFEKMPSELNPEKIETFAYVHRYRRHDRSAA